MDLTKILTRGKGDQFAASEKVVPSTDDSGTGDTATFTQEQVAAALSETEARTAAAYEAASLLGGDSGLAKAFLAADLSEDAINTLGKEISSVTSAQIKAAIEASKAETADTGNEEGEEQRDKQARRADFRTKAAAASVDVPDSPAPEEKDEDSSGYLQATSEILKEKKKA